MPRTTVAYKLNNKTYIGILDRHNNIDYFESLIAENSEGFEDNTFYVMMLSDDDYPDIVEMEQIKVDFSEFEDEDYIATANNVLSKFKTFVVYH